jgi:hypothetical protein
MERSKAVPSYMPVSNVSVTRCLPSIRRSIEYPVSADADLKRNIVDATLRREPRIDFQTAQAARLDDLDDEAVLRLVLFIWRHKSGSASRNTAKRANP